MAQQDKTDWYWNGVLAGAVNNLYYDLINVDVVHVPYATTHRNSSFFLQTRPNYYASRLWTDYYDEDHRNRDVVDVRFVWRDSCSKNNWEVYVLLANKWRTKIRVHWGKVVDWCVQSFNWEKSRWREFTTTWCWAFKFFSTDYVRWKRILPWEAMEETKEWSYEPGLYNWIQINRYEGWITHWYFSDKNIEDGSAKFKFRWSDPDNPDEWVWIWDYILVYAVDIPDKDWRGFAWQVRMITWIEDGELVLDEPWQGFKTLSSEDDEDEVKWTWVAYYIFSEWDDGSSAWWEVVWVTDWREIYIINDVDDLPISIYNQTWTGYTNILSVAEALGKVYILTDNWYIHYSNYSWYDKFFIQDDVFAWVDKTSIVSYRDIILAFWNRHIAVWMPDEENTYTTMYNQSSTVWLWSRYSYAEYDGDLVFISNDKRMLALWIASNTWKYMLQYEDVWDMLNWKLSTLTVWDEVFIWNDNNNLRVFIQTKSKPYYNDDWDWEAKLTNTWKYKQENTMTRIVKFDKQFKVRTEDWVQWILLQWVEYWTYYWENWIYDRWKWSDDWKWNLENYHYPFKTYITAYLIENETDWVWWTSSWLSSRPKLYNVAKLNRLITTLWPGEYTHDSVIKITSYVKWLWVVYQFPIDGDGNDWVGMMTTKYTWEVMDDEYKKKLECIKTVVQDGQSNFQPKCVWTPHAAIQNMAQTHPRCNNYTEMLVLDKWVCIDDSLYELAPTMPLVTSLWENQNYATQIKLELIWCPGDIITFGGWLWEMFIAPLFTIWPDWEYQLQPNTDC